MHWPIILERIPLYLHYFLFSANEHALQSPFAFHFYNQVLKGKDIPPQAAEIESVRTQLLQSKEEISTKSFGMPSTVTQSEKAGVCQIAKRGISARKDSELFRRIAVWTNAQHILELGTSLGVNTMYLASASEEVKVTTIEGNPDLIAVARRGWQQCGFTNINVIEGQIEQVFDQNIPEQADFIFIDANHKSDALWHYYNCCQEIIKKEAVMIIDDIRWSADMFKGWQMLCQQEEVRLSLDLKHFGILFFDKNMAKKHHVLTY